MCTFTHTHTYLGHVVVTVASTCGVILLVAVHSLGLLLGGRLLDLPRSKHIFSIQVRAIYTPKRTICDVLYLILFYT
jgi:hypothetical protein